MAICWNCGTDYETPDLLTRESECPSCAAYLRSCRNCEFYEPNAHNQCRETQAELQANKEVANSCDYFRAATEPKQVGNRMSKLNIGDLFKGE